MTTGAPDGTRAAFDAAMAAFAPWEPAPRLALAVSGGADSMALSLLAARWAAARGGAVVALVVDHGLRPGSADEARRVAGWCRDRGIASEILTVTDAAPATGIEEWARRQRYGRLDEACRRHGLLHLLTAHHADDQSETVTLRRERGSGSLGLAGMSACREGRHHRLLRPLLAVRKAKLEACCRTAGLCWIEDPMNRDPRFARARLRLAPGRPDPGVDATRRTADEARLCHVLPQVAFVDLFGVGRLRRDGWSALAPELRRTVLARLALVVGGAEHTPSTAGLERLARQLVDGQAAATLGRCLWRRQSAGWRVEREGRALPAPAPLQPGRVIAWDGRFEVVATLPGLVVAPLAATEPAAWPAGRRSLGLSAAATAALPAFHDLEGLVAVPHLGYTRRSICEPATVRLRPRHGLSPVPFVVAGDGLAGDEGGRGAFATAC